MDEGTPPVRNGTTTSVQAVRPPASPTHPTHTAGFTHSPLPYETDYRASSDGRTLKSMDGGNPLHAIPSTRRQIYLPDMAPRASVDLDNYFSGPVDPARHSKLPFWLRIHGSILPKLIIPLFVVGGWTTMIVCISEFVYPLVVDSLLLTVLGFVVALALSFRSSSAYERYGEGRKYWAQLILHSRNLSHYIWVHMKERPETEKDDLLNKLTAINLILAFAQACKHKLRHEVEYDYSDIKPLINHLDTFAKQANVTDRTPTSHNRSLLDMNTWGEYLGIPMYQTNPRHAIKAAAKQGRHHGNLPYEIIVYLGQHIHTMNVAGALDSGVVESQIYTAFNNLLDAYGGCDRVLQTPLPIAYNIAISQITWLYVLVLPFQLYANLRWIAIPGTLVAAYIILGIAAIGREIEDPFGRDVNDLDLDRYCAGLQYDLNVLTSRPACDSSSSWASCDSNKPLWPYSNSGFNDWKSRSLEEIRVALKNKVDQQAETAGEGQKLGRTREEKPGDA